MGHFRPGERITQIHGTRASVAPVTGARDSDSFALFHPAAALRSTDVERQSYDDIAGLPNVLREARARRAAQAARAPLTTLAPAADPVQPAFLADASPTSGDDAPTLFQA
jgi:hypothetical protein